MVQDLADTGRDGAGGTALAQEALADAGGLDLPALRLFGEADAAGEGALFDALGESVGRPLNEWIGGDKDDWLAVLDCGLAWVDASDDPFTPRAAFPEAWAEQREGFQALRDDVAALPAEDLRASREAAGLPNR